MRCEHAHKGIGHTKTMTPSRESFKVTSFSANPTETAVVVHYSPEDRTLSGTMVQLLGLRKLQPVSKENLGSPMPLL